MDEHAEEPRPDEAWRTFRRDGDDPPPSLRSLIHIVAPFVLPRLLTIVLLVTALIVLLSRAF